MKTNLLKKLAASCVMFFGLLTLGGCMSTNPTDAKIDVTNSVVQIIDVGGEKHVRSALGVVNNTIFTTKTFDIGADVEYVDLGVTRVEHIVLQDEPLALRPGAAGIVYSEWKLEYPSVTKITITQQDTVLKSYYNLWESYLGWWIAMIVIAAVALLAYGITIFSKDVGGDDVWDIFKAHLGTALVCFMFVFIICMFPLFFGQWFTTIILLATFVFVMLGQLGITAIKSAVSKK